MKRFRVALGEGHPNTLHTMSNLASALFSQGKHRESEILYRQILDKFFLIRGETHPSTIDAMSSLANALSIQTLLQTVYQRVELTLVLCSLLVQV